MPKDKGKKLPDLGLAYWPLKSTTNYVMKNPPPPPAAISKWYFTISAN